jgi:hypothetical protein
MAKHRIAAERSCRISIVHRHRPSGELGRPEGFRSGATASCSESGLRGSGAETVMRHGLASIGSHSVIRQRSVSCQFGAAQASSL